jgi:hypothetical protein
MRYFVLALSPCVLPPWLARGDAAWTGVAGRGHHDTYLSALKRRLLESARSRLGLWLRAQALVHGRRGRKDPRKRRASPRREHGAP